MSIAVCSKFDSLRRWSAGLLALIFLCGSSVIAVAQEPAAEELSAELKEQMAAAAEKYSQLKWVNGPAVADLGSRAQIKVPEGYKFLNSHDAQTLLTLFGNPQNPSILGLVQPAAESEDVDSWFIVFQFEDIGYIKDADKEKIDAHELLSSFRAGIEEGNKQRRMMGGSELREMDWSDQPFYDPQTNNLTWGLRLKFDEGDSINYDIRMLGRAGVMSATLVGSPETYQAAVGPTKHLLSGFEFKEGSKYADWKPGDKVAAVGLTALIGGGSLAIAAKTGLLAKLGLILAKMGKAVIIVIFAIGAGVVGLFKKIFGSRQYHDTTQQ